MFTNKKVTLAVTVLFSVLLVLTITGFSFAQVVEVSFLNGGPGNGGNNKYDIYDNSATQDGWGEGAIIANPVWIGSSLPGPILRPKKNKPVCYGRSQPGTPSRMKVELAFKLSGTTRFPPGFPVRLQKFKLEGLEGNNLYFQQENLQTTRGITKVTMKAVVDLPTTVSVLTKTFSWRIVPQVPGYHPKVLATSTHKIYVVYDTPITTGVEGQDNKLTPKRLDFSCGAAAGKGDLVGVTYSLASKVAQETGPSYSPPFYNLPNPRWLFYSQTNRNLDCHQRAALAASAFGIVGIKGYVGKVYATCYPVPQPGPYGPNSTTNDYESSYTDNRFKYQQIPTNCIQKLMFPGNNFEGNIRVKDGSADDGYIWYTIWPLTQHTTAKELLIWYAANSQFWHTISGACPDSGTVPVPVNHLADMPTIIGGPN